MTKGIVKPVLGGICLAGILAMAGSVNAASFTIGDANSIGLVVPDHPTSPNDDAQYINHLIVLSPGGSTTFSGETITRSMHNFSPMDPIIVPVSGDPVGSLPGTGTSVSLGSGYEYLMAKYDAGSAGGEVWYVGGLAGTVTIPAFFTSDNQYGLSGWTLFNPLDNGSHEGGAPDGGTTVALLGFGLLGIGALRQKFSRN